MGPSSSSPKGAQPPISVHVCCGQTAGWIKMPLGREIGLGPGKIVLDGNPAPPKKGHSPHFSVHDYCGQTAGWIKMPLGTKVGLGPAHIVLDGNPARPSKSDAAPNFRLMSIVAKRSPISATDLFDLNSTLLQLDSTFWLDSTLKLNCHRQLRRVLVNVISTSSCFSDPTFRK